MSILVLNNKQMDRDSFSFQNVVSYAVPLLVGIVIAALGYPVLALIIVAAVIGFIYIINPEKEQNGLKALRKGLIADVRKEKQFSMTEAHSIIKLCKAEVYRIDSKNKRIVFILDDQKYTMKIKQN